MKPEFASNHANRGKIKPPTKSEMALAKSRTGLDSVSGELLAQFRSEARSTGRPAKPVTPGAVVNDAAVLKLNRQIERLRNQVAKLKVQLLQKF